MFQVSLVVLAVVLSVYLCTINYFLFSQLCSMINIFKQSVSLLHTLSGFSQASCEGN